MSTNRGERARIFIHEVKILVAHVPNERIGIGEKSRVVQVALGYHDTLAASHRHTFEHIVVTEYVAVGEHRDLHGLFHCLYVLPVGQARVVSFLLSGSTMHGQKLSFYS